MSAQRKIPVWDAAVRLFHWSLAASFLIAYASGDEESLLHVYAGYAIAALIVLRIVWGFVGTRHARFSDFVVGPATTLRYARSLFGGAPRRYLGHNPLGGWMVIALLATLLATTWTGVEAYGAQGKGPLAQVQSPLVAQAFANGERERGRQGRGDEFWEEAHEALATLTLVLVLLHIGGVLLGSALHRENLIKAMITGYKVLPAPDPPGHSSKHHHYWRKS